MSKPGRPVHGTSDATLGESEWIKHCSSTSVNSCGAAESKRKAVEGHEGYPFISVRVKTGAQRCCEDLMGLLSEGSFK